jgi:hypothetical protein
MGGSHPAIAIVNGPALKRFPSTIAAHIATMLMS